MRIHGNEYASNDLVALAADLEVITSCGVEIRPLHALVTQWLESPSKLEGKALAALTCDDGADFDAVPLTHPTWGQQRSVLGILSDFRAQQGNRQPDLHVTSFVIASPEARVELDRTCMVGRGWWNESWWRDAVDSGLMSIGNHSWDHNHETLARPCRGLVRPGTFATVDTLAAAEYEIRFADEYLRSRIPNPGNRLFAYPFGETNDFLSGQYLPEYSRDPGSAGFDAAFITDPAYLTRSSDRWRLPRFVCGRDWHSPDELRSILRRAQSA